MKSKVVKYGFILLVAVVYIGTLAMALVVSIVDKEDIAELQWKSLSRYNSSKEACYMTGCSQRATYECKYSVESQYSRYANLSIPNEANVKILSSSKDHYTYDSAVKKEDYLVFEEQPDGSYDAYIEEKEYWYEVEDERFDHYYTTVWGYYCEDHVEEAEEIIRDELVSAMKSSFAYVWAGTLFPWNLMFIAWLITFVMEFRARKGATDFPKWIFWTTAIGCLGIAICSTISSFAVRGTLVFILSIITGFIGTGCAAYFGRSLGIKSQQKKQQKQEAIEINSNHL